MEIHASGGVWLEGDAGSFGLSVSAAFSCLYNGNVCVCAVSPVRLSDSVLCPTCPFGHVVVSVIRIE